jgi:ATP-dependent RNA helicase DBP3
MRAEVEREAEGSEAGSGKTSAFGIPALARLSSAGSVAGKGPRTLVLALVLELALQTSDVISALDAVQCVAVLREVDKTQQARVIPCWRRQID